MKSTLMNQTPATGPSSCVASVHSASASPNAAAQGTALSFAAGTAVDAAAAAGVRSIDLPGSPPRGAPV